MKRLLVGVIVTCVALFALAPQLSSASVEDVSCSATVPVTISPGIGSTLAAQTFTFTRGTCSNPHESARVGGTMTGSVACHDHGELSGTLKFKWKSGGLSIVRV